MHLRDAHAAANKANEIKGRQAPCVAWDRYCEAQGGVFCGRKARIKLMMVAPEKLGRYGETNRRHVPLASRPGPQN
ncbi:MAG: hypothetical protein V9G23_18800 [Giesbergeria sp.]